MARFFQICYNKIKTMFHIRLKLYCNLTAVSGTSKGV